MKSESPAKIFNSGRRGIEETAAYKCFHTFHLNETKRGEEESFGPLKFFNDAFLSPQQSITYTHEENTRIIILPLTGGLSYQYAIQKEELVSSEQIKVIEVEKGGSYTFSNPYEKEWINYLHIGFRIHSSLKCSSVLQNIEWKNKNELVCFGLEIPDQPASYIGVYEGRSEGCYTLKNPDNGVFIYVINGAFEVQGRLLEYRDGLSLWNTTAVEFEALSNNAIILLFEINLKQ